MNDRDWFKKLHRGPRGGCTVWLGLVGLVAAWWLT
jgi:hypothetical protein